MATVFLMLTMLVQATLAMSARSAADSAVSAAARRASLPGTDSQLETDRLVSEIGSVIPGALEVIAEVSIDTRRSLARASFRWIPPGPVLLPLTISVRSEVPRANPP